MASTQGNGRRYIGKPLEKVDAREQVTGKALFGADLHVPGMLYGRVLRSPYPHARIKKLDYQKALELRGVRAVITAEDLPPVTQRAEAFGGELMIALKDLRRLVLAHDKVLFDGHPIAAVAATTPEVAEEATGLIEVEYELLPPVENVVDAMREDSLLLHEDLFTKTLEEAPTRPSNVALYLESGRGNVEMGLSEADVVVENTYDTKMVHQGYLEPQACLAKPKDDYSITLWTSTQGIFNVLRQLTALLELPQDKVTVVPAEIGGGFGGKIYTILEPLAILLARKSDHPVKMVMDRSEVLRATGPTSPTHVTVKVGAKKDGRLTACFIRMVYDAGAFPGAPIDGASLVCFGPYKTDNLRIEAYDVVTNKPRVQAYRAPGGTAASFAVETSMDELAERLGIDPLQFRLINAMDEGDLMTNDTPYQRIGLKEMLKRVAEHPAWTSPLQGPNRERGLGLGFWLGATLTSSAVIMVHPDGTVTVSSGQVDLTGTRTTMRQMVAEELQLPIEHVTARVVDTNSAPYTDLSAGSRTTYTMSVAAYEAAHDALRQMKRHAAHQMKVSPEEVEYTDGRFWVRENPEQAIDWLEVARLSVRRNEGPVCGYGTVTRLPSAPAFAAHVADVEVDPETGRTRVVKYTSFQDVGKAINPQQVEGQIQGGATQGIGWALFEYYHYDKGVLKNASLLDYRTPTSLDLPMLDTVIVEVPSPASPYGVRGVGEVPIVPPPSAIANALYRVTGVRMRQLPMTPEAVFWAMKEKERLEQRVPAGAEGDGG